MTTPTIDQLMALTRGIPLTRAVLKTALEKANHDQRAFMADLLRAEHESRKQAKHDRLLRQARFPVRKTLDNYDYAMITWPANWQKDNLLKLEFIPNHHDLVFYGDVGTGKTHLAIALGHAACQAGYPTRFFTTASLIAYLRQAQDKGTLEAAINTIGKVDLIIIDEFGYLPIDTTGARLLYQIIANAYETQSIIYTSKLEFSRWSTILGDANMAAAIIDRTIHHGRILTFTGTSWHLSHSTMK
ncbi:IS21-like element helper ATPase IstB [Arcanobacterium phocae]|uniref:IS21-like element helper ATPase IstB n=1 Tax=Arcanobacterium phocae TaxID=131112 RepID=UPI001E554AC8|nr:IS21-like element helper ATPase IstB [Arcanobacterium phocae]